MIRKIVAATKPRKPKVPDTQEVINARKHAVEASVALTQAQADFANGKIDALQLQTAHDALGEARDALRAAADAAKTVH